MRIASTYFISAVLVALTLSACANEGVEPDVGDGKHAPAFTATIGETPSRAFGRSWEPGDEIGVSGCSRNNVCYLTSDGNGVFSPKETANQIYFQNNAEAAFTAYYPWTNLDAGATTINADTRDQDKQKRFDFLWAQASGKKDAPDVAFTFAHKMAKLSLTVKPGNDITYEELSQAALSFEGLGLTGAFNITDGTTELDAAGEPWIFSGFAQKNDTEQSVVFSFILFPQVFAQPLALLAGLNTEASDGINIRAAIDFTNANKALDGAAAQNEWAPGRQYNLSLTLHKTRISLDKCVINPWNQVVGDEITVD